MISHLHKCIFVHIPKTGGTSIEDVIWPDKSARTAADLWRGTIDKHRNKYQTGGLQHLLARQIREEVGSEVFAAYYKFAMVRNPWDKAVSQFVFMDGREDLRQQLGMKKGNSFKKYISLLPKRPHVQWAPQIDFTHDADGKQLVDYVGRFESFSETVHHALAAIGMSADSIPHAKRGSRKPYQEYYDAESMEMLAEVYADDIATFGYAFGELTGGSIAPAAIGDDASPGPWNKVADLLDRLRRRRRAAH